MTEQKARVGQATPSKAGEPMENEIAAADMAKRLEEIERREAELAAKEKALADAGAAKKPVVGLCEVFVAVPGKVGTGEVGRPFADVLEQLFVTERNAVQLEEAELAFRNKVHAEAKHEMWKRKRDADMKAAREAAERRALGRYMPKEYREAI